MLFFYILCVVALIVISKWITGKKFSPITIYNLIWLAIVLLYQLRLSNLQPELSDATYWLLMIKSVVFTLGFLACYCIKNKRGKNLATSASNEKVADTSKKLDVTDIKVAKYKKVIGLMFLVWFVAEIFETIYSGGVPILWKMFGDSRTYFDYGIPTLHGFMNALGLVIMMLAFLGCLKKESTKKDKMTFVSIIAVCLVFYLCIFTRQVIVSAIIQMIAVFFLVKRPVKLRKAVFWMGLLSIVGVIAFGFVGNIRTGYEGFLSVAGISMGISPFFVGFYWVYMYLTMSLANINNAVVLGVNHFGGLFPAVRNFLPTVVSKVLFADSAVVIPNYLVTKAFNVSGYFIDFYVGLGTLGVIIIAAIYGILGGIIYRALQKRRTERNILLYAVYLQIIILSFFFNHLFYLPSGFQFVIILVVYHFLERKPSHGKN